MALNTMPRATRLEIKLRPCIIVCTYAAGMTPLFVLYPCLVAGSEALFNAEGRVNVRDSNLTTSAL